MNKKPLAHVPIEFSFHPKEEDLVCCYLYNKVNNKPFPCEIPVKECNFYGDKEPWELWETNGGANLKRNQTLYFFTELKRKGPNDSRYRRRIGLDGGFWRGENTTKIILDQKTKRSLGFKKVFRYYNTKSKHNGRWFMHEYSLHPLLAAHSSCSPGQASKYVICQLGKRESVSVSGNKRKLKNGRKTHETHADHQKNPTIARKQHDTTTEVGLKSGTSLSVSPPTSVPPQPPINSFYQRSSLCSDHEDQVEVVEVSDKSDYETIHTEWAIGFAEELLKDQPPEIPSEEPQVELLPNMVTYREMAWLGISLSSWKLS